MPKPPRIEPPGDVVARLASIASALPDAYEEDAWTGVRWRVRNKTFAHVLVRPSAASVRLVNVIKDRLVKSSRGRLPSLVSAKIGREARGERLRRNR